MTTFALVAAVVAEIEHVIFGPNVGREPSIRETAPGRDGNATFNTRLAAFALSDLDRTAGGSAPTGRLVCTGGEQAHQAETARSTPQRLFDQADRGTMAPRRN